MSGSRFGVGLVAGVFFALVVIVVSGAIASTSTPLYGTGSPSSPAATTSSITLTTGTVTGVFATSGNQTASTTQSNQNSLGSLNSGGTNPATAQVSSSLPRFSSELATMNQLSTPARALLLAPVVIAFLVGALLYRASLARRGREDS
jgi:hypothetical protein